METRPQTFGTDRFAQGIENSKRIRRDIDEDVIKGREFDLVYKFLPDGLTKLDELAFLTDTDWPTAREGDVDIATDLARRAPRAGAEQALRLGFLDGRLG